MPEREDVRAACRAIAERALEGALSPEVALMEMLIASEDAALVGEVVHTLARTDPRASAARLAALADEHGEGCRRVAAILRAERPLIDPPAVDEGLAECRGLFDGLVAQSEEASVALYSLASPRILAEATRELVALLAGWGALSPRTRVLDLGCGIGRMAVALAPHVARVHGVDLSPGMVETARRRTAHLDTVRIDRASGRDLAGIDTASLDLVLAVDCFPYIVRLGPELTAALTAEVARVLAVDGVCAIFNFSYRDDLARDREELARLAEAHGLAIEVNGDHPLTLWNAAVFRLRRR